ncbi:MAG: hypothetical protein KBS81_09760, partial [Spirochaetales bacterium]|nr:hypothetical protein [Candidatus Physcosoma equi]
MSSLKKRLLTAIVGIPLLLLFIFLPFFNHISLSILLIVCNAIGVYELHHNLIKKKIDVPATGLLGMLLPVVEVLQARCFPAYRLTAFTVCAALGVAFLVEIFHGAKDNFERSLERISATVLN